MALALAFVLALVLFAEFRSGVLNINVTNRVNVAVTYIVLVDGHEAGSGPLGPNQTVQLSVSPSWWIDACHNHDVLATSNAHMVAPEPASVVLCSDTSQSVSLSI